MRLFESQDTGHLLQANSHAIIRGHQFYFCVSLFPVRNTFVKRTVLGRTSTNLTHLVWKTQALTSSHEQRTKIMAEKYSHSEEL